MSYLFDIWLIPMIIVSGIVSWIMYKSVRKWQVPKLSTEEMDQPIPETIEKHPYVINPIFWIMFMVTVFISFVIFYYWAIWTK